MKMRNYVCFEIEGIKHDDFENIFEFSQDAECEVTNDAIVKKILIKADISKATLYLNDSVKITNESAPQIVEYLSEYLAKIMISVIKNSSMYSKVLLEPSIRVSEICFVEIGTLDISDGIGIRDEVALKFILNNGDSILQKWIQDAETLDYTNKKDKYDILFLLLQGTNAVQKYMAMYAYLMGLVKEFYSNKYEAQRQVVQYVRDNCARVGIVLIESQSTRPGAKTSDKEDQFTALRNKIAHPSIQSEDISVHESAINGLASIICCAIEDLPS